MRLFSEEVTPTFTSSNLNILTVKDFYEVFFDVYELEINGKKYITEKVSEYKGSPVVSVNIVLNNKEYTTNCVLQRGKFNFLVNEETLKYVCDVSSVDDIILSEKEDESVFDEIIFEKHESLLEDIQEAKLSAKRYLDSLKKQQQEDINKHHAQKRKEFDTELKSIKEDLVEEFIRIANSVKSNVEDTNQATAADFKNLVNDQVLKLTKTINKNFSLQKEELEEYIDESVNTTASTIISTVLANELKASNDSLNDRVSKLYEHVNSKLTELVSEHKSITEKKLKNVIDDVDRKILNLEKASTELNDTISKNTNKALSRIGNVKTQIERSITETVSALQSDIEKASDRVRYFYDKEIEKINENVSTLNDTVRQDCIKLVSESKESLLKMISDIKVDVPNIIIEKKDGTGSEINLKKIKSELEKTISSRFTNELMSLKRMMEMMSGGGSVAQQFANGGIMNGNLTVVGAISASQYLGLPGGGGVSGDYLPLSGGTITGNLEVTGSTSVDNVTFDQTPELAGGVGVLRWNDEDGTLDLGLKGGNVTLQLGQEQVVRVVNRTGADLLESEYKVVRIRLAGEGGAQGQRLAVVLAQANNDPDSATTLGLVTENIGNNQEGFITTSGVVRGINTTGSLQGETWADGDVLYLSPTVAGRLTKVKPQAPDHTVVVGYVEYAHQNNGKIFVKVDNGYELDELHNVRITSVSANDILKYDAVQNVWTNSPPNFLSLSGSEIQSDNITSNNYFLSDSNGILTTSKNVRSWLAGTASFSVFGQESNPQSVDFKPDGTEMYITGSSSDRVFQYSLSAAWDLNSASYTGKNLNLTNIDANGTYFKPDGTEIFVINNVITANLDRIRRFTLSAAWDISSANPNPIENLQINTIPGLSGIPTGICFKPDGTKMYISDTSVNANAVYELNLSQAWTLSSASLVLPRLNVQSIETSIQDVVITSDGTRLLIIGAGSDRIAEYKLPIPWSLSGSYLDGVSFTTTSVEGTPTGLYYNDIANKCFYVGTGDIVRDIIVEPQPAIVGTKPLILANPTDVNDKVIINSLRITDTTASTNSSTGALLVVGGIGVSGNINSASNMAAVGFQAAATSGFFWSSRSLINSPADGVIRLTNNAVNGFDRLQFGGIDSNFPAIKRNGTGLDIAFADQATTGPTPLSGLTDLRAANITANGNLIANNVVYTNTDQTIGGDKTFTNNVQVNSNITAPNQTLSPTSVLNYRLAQLVSNTQTIPLVPLVNGYSLVTTASANTSIFTDSGFIRLDAANNLGFGGITAGTAGGTSAAAMSIGENVNGRENYMNFSGAVGISFLIKSGGDSFDPSLQDWAVAIGAYDTIADHNITSLYPLTQGTGGYRAYFCITCNAGQVRLRVCDRLGTRVDSAVLDTISGIQHFSRNYTIISQGGVASLYRNRTLLGQVSGATTHNDLNGASGGLFFNHTASAIGTVQRRRLYLVNSNVWWENI